MYMIGGKIRESIRPSQRNGFRIHRSYTKIMKRPHYHGLLPALLLAFFSLQQGSRGMVRTAESASLEGRLTTYLHLSKLMKCAKEKCDKHGQAMVLPDKLVHRTWTRCDKTAFNSLAVADIISRWKMDLVQSNCDAATSCVPCNSLILENEFVLPVLHEELRVVVDSDERIVTAGICEFSGVSSSNLTCLTVSHRTFLSQSAANGASGELHSLTAGGVTSHSQLGGHLVWQSETNSYHRRDWLTRLNTPEPDIDHETNSSSSSFQNANSPGCSGSLQVGRWTDPYFSCGFANTWVTSYLLPLLNGTLGHNHHNRKLWGIVGIEIALDKADIAQCNSTESVKHIAIDDGYTSDSNLCHSSSTNCLQVHGNGFRTGAYRCKCKQGFYHPDRSVLQTGFLGEDFDKYFWSDTCTDLNGSEWNVSKAAAFIEHLRCLPCHKSCRQHNVNCTDGRSCLYHFNKVVMAFGLALNVLAVSTCVLTVAVIIRFRHQPLLRASSWRFLILILVGEIIGYSVANLYLIPTDGVCSSAMYFFHASFLLSYVSFFVKLLRLRLLQSRDTVLGRRRADDCYLIKRLLAIYLCYSIPISLWTTDYISGIGPKARLFRSSLGGRTVLFKSCDITWPELIVSGAEVGLNVWGVWLAFVTTRISSSFREKHTLKAVYIGLATNITYFALILTMYAYQRRSDEEVDSDLPPWFAFLSRTMHGHLLHTPMFLLLFVPKLVKLWKRKGGDIDYRITSGVTIDQQRRAVQLFEVHDRTLRRPRLNSRPGVQPASPLTLRQEAITNRQRLDPHWMIRSYSCRLDAALRAERERRKEEQREDIRRLTPVHWSQHANPTTSE